MRIAIVGADRSAADYANRIETIESTTLAGVTAGTGGERAPESPTVTHVADERLYADHETLYEEAAPDGVVVCAPPEACREPAVAALDRGISVLRPGRLAGDVADGAAIVDAAETADAVAIGGYASSFSPERATAAQRATDGELGTVGNVRLFRRHSAEDTERDSPPRVGPPLEFFRLVGGPISHVFAHRTTTASGRGMLVTLRSETDVVGHLDVREDDGAERRRFEIAGTDGLVEFDSDDVAPVTIRQAGSSTTAVEVPLERDAVARQVMHLADCLRGTATPRISLRDALSTLRVCDAVDLSAEQGARVGPSEVEG